MNWETSVTFECLVKLMVEADLQAMCIATGASLDPEAIAPEVATVRQVIHQTIA